MSYVDEDDIVMVPQGLWVFEFQAEHSGQRAWPTHMNGGFDALGSPEARPSRVDIECSMSSVNVCQLLQRHDWASIEPSFSSSPIV